MITLLASGLGQLMRICYHIVDNYAIAIILFTILTKVLLLPLSIWVQKNSIKMVRMQPEINRIKVKFFGLPDQIADEQSDLYKREKYNPFADMIPMLVQIILLMGLIQVIYNPLTHIFRLDTGIITRLIEQTSQLTGIDISNASIQMQVVDAIQNPEYWKVFVDIPGGDLSGIISRSLAEIKVANMDLMGVSLSLIPSIAGGITLVVPLMAGVSAWLMCVAQNHFNPLQAEQGKGNQWGMLLLSVGISLFLGAFVPTGVGFYWILSNLFTIIQQLLLNIIINPKRFINYEELEASKKELAYLNNLDGKKSIFARNPHAVKEKQDYKRFFSIANKHLVFYSEKNGFYKYYEGMIEYLLGHTNVVIHYITSDAQDNVFQKENDRFKVYYIGAKKIITLMMKMDAEVVIMTMPDLDNYHIKRSYVKNDIQYIYIPHGMDSLNMTMRKGSMDHFDAILCIGPHQKEEIEKTEQFYKLNHKELVEWGYSLLDTMRREYEGEKHENGSKKRIMIAPSWQEDNIMDSCIESILDNLSGNEYEIIVRPHPQHVRHQAAKIEMLKEKYTGSPNIVIEIDFSSNRSVFESDIMVTDWSGIAYEFAYTTCKPVLFINTPMKVMNTEYQVIDTVPLNILLRDEIGCSLDLANIDQVSACVEKLIEESGQYKNKIESFVNQYVYNLGKSDEVGAKYILSKLIKQKK